MSTDLVAKLDLPLAWSRLVQERKDRAFTRHPFEVGLVQVDLHGFLSGIRSELENDTYSPNAAYVANVPKGKGAVRPGACLSIADRLVYTAAVGALLPKISTALGWPPSTIDFSYPLTKKFDDPRWIIDEYKAWGTFRTASLDALKGCSYGVLTDITGYYENIDLATLHYDLMALGGDEEVVELVMKCLNKWSQVGGRGIPQSQPASDILGKLYLNSVDRSMYDAGYRHYRYVDDIRIFCSDYSIAKEALIELSVLLRKRGLNIQTSKSSIRRVDEARAEIEGISKVIEDVQRRYISELKESLDVEGYLPSPELDRLLQSKPLETPIEVLRETYKAYFSEGDPYQFDKTLFHFLIKRLGKAKDRFALDHCAKLLDRHPQETAYVLEYFEAIGAVADMMPVLAEFINSREAVYTYQIYQIFEWLYRVTSTPIDSLITSARIRAFSGDSPPFLKAICRQFLARFGNVADLEKLQHAYDSAGSHLEQAEIMCCLARMEKGRRNAFLARTEGDGNWNRRAAEWVRKQILS